MKIAFWWRQPSGYFDACTKELAERGHEVHVVFEESGTSAPFTELNSAGANEHLASLSRWKGRPRSAQLRSTMDSDVLITASWGVPVYLAAAAKVREPTLRLVGVDTPWTPTPKQALGRVTHRSLLHRAFDGAWVTGFPQWELVRRLGFRSEHTIEHLYCCDSNLYSPRTDVSARYRQPFIFVGRKVPEKGIQTLKDAFVLFRQRTGSERELTIVGQGDTSAAAPGINEVGFAEPAAAAKMMDESFALVHPASDEHWGVVVHEAASLGLPIITTRHVNAATRFMSDGVSGFYSGTTVESLAQNLEQLDRLSEADYLAMSARSKQLGNTLTLDDWVSNFERGVMRIRGQQ